MGSLPLRWRAMQSKPMMSNFLFRQKHRHGLGMDWADNIVRFRRQEREESMLAGLALPLAGP
jgi:hypothetical protein